MTLRAPAHLIGSGVDRIRLGPSREAWAAWAGNFLLTLKPQRANSLAMSQGKMTQLLKVQGELRRGHGNSTQLAVSGS